MASLVNIVLEKCDNLITNHADPRVSGWLFLTSPFPIIVYIFSYLYFVLEWGPRFMKNRQPYSLKTIISMYNILQIFACTWIFYGILTSGWTDHLSLGCQPVEVSYDPQSMKLASLMWWTMVLKMVELIETVFFVLRKKNNQVSFLHLYHHVTTLSLMWIGAKFVPGGMATFPIMPNCLVHILMYTYYLITALGPNWQKRIAKYKPYLTLIQMIQFTIMVLHSLQALVPSCPVPRILAYIYIPNVFIVFYLFYDFYHKTYKTKMCAQ